jgi:hypothetical protein
MLTTLGTVSIALAGGFLVGKIVVVSTIRSVQAIKRMRAQ